MKANRFTRNEEGYTNLVPLVLAVIIVFAIIFVGAFVNGAIYDSLTKTYPSASQRTPLQNSTVETLNNMSGNWDSALNIVQVTIIITILASAIAAIFLFTRFR